MDLGFATLKTSHFPFSFLFAASPSVIFATTCGTFASFRRTLDKGVPMHRFWLALLLTSLNLSLCSQTSLAQPPSSGGTQQEEKRDPKVVQIESLADRSTQLIREGKFDQALSTGDEALKIDDKSALAHVIRGRAFNAQRQFDKAIEALDAALAQPNRDRDAENYRSQAYAAKSYSLYEQGKYLPAVDSAYLGTLEKYDNVDCHMNRARAYLARREWDKAINSLNRVIGIDAKSAEAYSQRGFAYANKDNFDQCINDQTKAIELDGKLAIAYQRRAGAQINKKKLPEAVKDLDQALQLQPTLAEALCDRAILMAANKNPVQAENDIEAALRSDPRCVRAYVLKSQQLVTRERYAEAISVLDRAATEVPGQEVVLAAARGAALQGKKDYAGAVKEFTRVIDENPKNYQALQARANAYRKLGKEEEALADFAKAKEYAPKEPEKKDSKKKKDDKDKDKEKERPPMFIVKSKPVESKPQAIEAVKQMAAEIDKMVLTGLKKNNVSPNPKTSDEQFLRRVYLDVTGSIPSYRETMKFLSSKDPDKRAKLIDELLNGEGYASHFYNYWADVLRYKDNLSNDVRGEPFRQWLKQSLAENKPWNKMVYEMLTAEGLIWDNPATGYFQRDPGMPLDVMNNTIRIFLGTRIGCAQCHDHPFDRWTQREFYEIAAFTFGTTNGTYGGDKRFFPEDPNKRLQEEYSSIVQEEEDRRNNSYRFNRMINVNMRLINDQDRKITLPKDYQYSNGKPGEVVAPKTLFGPAAEIKQGEPPRKAFARWVVSKDNPRFAKTIANRLWKQVFGAGQFEPVDDLMDDSKPENPELMEYLESTMKRINFNMKEYVRILLNTEAYQRQSSSIDIAGSDRFHFPGPVMRRMTAEQAWDSFVTLAVDEVEYHEQPATMRTEPLSVNLEKASAMEVLEEERKANQAEGQIGQIQSKYRYRGELLARASELPQPVPANHFLRVFGQSDRELISASSTSGSVPQILFMFNGPVTHMLLEKNSTIYNNITRKSSVSEGVRAAFLTVLSRSPDPEELEAAIAEVKEKGLPGYGNVVWSLVNTREFLFIQ